MWIECQLHLLVVIMEVNYYVAVDLQPCIMLKRSRQNQQRTSFINAA